MRRAKNPRPGWSVRLTRRLRRTNSPQARRKLGPSWSPRGTQRVRPAKKPRLRRRLGETETLRIGTSPRRGRSLRPSRRSLQQT